ncbi:MAG TPA: cytochrome c peroxidase [Anaerolineales bacterium]|nr:cytochrome c peroxidase [Anaerolineales bacterium]
MTASPNPPKTPWDQQPLTRRDLAILVGAIGVVLLAVVGTFVVLTPNTTGQPPTQVVATTATTGGTSVAAEPEYPSLAALPPAPFPLDNLYSEAKAELGKLLYFDPRMSGDGSTSCNSCHPANDGSWAIGSPMSFGYPGTTHWRNSQTIINTAYYTKLNWDGSATSIERQNNGAWTGTVAGNLDTAMAEERLAQIPEYVRLFKEVFGTDYPLYGDALKAVATFQRAIVSQNVPFDAYLSGDADAISDEARLGYDLFTGKANCIACHNGPLVSDDSFHNTGVATAPDFQTNALRQITARWQYWNRGVPEDEYATMNADLGLYYITKLDGDKGKFRTPSLRELCYTAPYMHNGVFATLEEVVAFYNAGGGGDPNQDPLLQRLNLNEQEEAAFVAFMHSLCGDKITVEAPELPAYEVWPNVILGGSR